MAEPRGARGLIDTSVVIDLDRVDASDLPEEIAVSAVTLAELVAGPLATADPAERARRRIACSAPRRHSIPCPSMSVPRAHTAGSTRAGIGAGRKARGRRAVDLLIAATALAAGLPVYTCNPDDYAHLTDLDVIAVDLRA